ncbi:MAG TPA: isoprenylcysteine carboxylmethyltransferase family protein [Pirellulales bacterium]|jgi:protein-S-isoprenylcysteine O-methyltransferase Ste14
MKRWLFFLYGAGSHLLFFGVFAYLACFVGNFLAPKSIDSPTLGSGSAAIAIDLLLLILFAAQHSVMARPAFKRIWTRVVPTPIERSTYVFFSCLVTILLIWQWRAIDTIVWDAQQPILRSALWVLFAFGWLLVPAVSLMIDHFDLFGSRQVWLYLRGREYPELPFRTPMLYRNVRHPLYIGWTIAFWATPTMTVGHLLFAIVMTVYMGLAALVEERDLVAHFGRHYENYRRQVPMFIPRFRATAEAPAHKTITTASKSQPEREKCKV